MSPSRSVRKTFSGARSDPGFVQRFLERTFQFSRCILRRHDPSCLVCGAIPARRGDLVQRPASLQESLRCLDPKGIEVMGVSMLLRSRREQTQCGGRKTAGAFVSVLQRPLDLIQVSLPHQLKDATFAGLRRQPRSAHRLGRSNASRFALACPSTLHSRRSQGRTGRPSGAEPLRVPHGQQDAYRRLPPGRDPGCGGSRE